MRFGSIAKRKDQRLTLPQSVFCITEDIFSKFKVIPIPIYEIKKIRHKRIIAYSIWLNFNDRKTFRLKTIKQQNNKTKALNGKH